MAVMRECRPGGTYSVLNHCLFWFVGDKRFQVLHFACTRENCQDGFVIHVA